MPIITDAAIASAARSGGWRDDRPSEDPEQQKHSELAVAVAVALAESSGNTEAVGQAGGQYYIGL